LAVLSISFLSEDSSISIFLGRKSKYRKKAPKKGALSLIYFAFFFAAGFFFAAVAFLAAGFFAVVFFAVVFLVTGITSS
jgi:fatty acid desaturase